MIHQRYPAISKSCQKIAVCLTQNPNEVAVMSVYTIASISGVHASSLVRFALALGHTGCKEMQRLFQKRLSTAAPGF